MITATSRVSSRQDYGAGTVMVWDSGSWEPAPEIDDPAEAIARGNLKFVLSGERLRGGWDLVRMKPRPKERQPQWLLIKRRDAEARPGQGAQLLDEATTSVLSGRTMEEIAAGKTPAKKRAKSTAGAEVGRPATKKVADAARPAPRLAGFVPPMLCALVDRAPERAGWVHEVKLDGYRMQAIIAGGRARLMTRSGLDWSHRFPEMVAALGRLPESILDGELVAADEHGTPDFAALKAAIERGGTGRLLFYAFDLIAQGDEDLRGRPLLERKAALKTMLGKAPENVVYLEHFERPGGAVLGSACRMGLEGIVSKRADSPYRSGERSGAWVKAKCRGNDEFVVGGYGAGAKGRITLVLGAWRNGRLVHLGRVGSGISEAQQRELARKLRPLRRDTSPFVDAPASERRATTWVEPVLVAEIDYAGWTGDGLLRQASFKGIRDDKPAREVGVPRPQEAPPQPEPRAATRRIPKASGGGDGLIAGVRLTNPDKLLWPADGISKRDLAAYYETVGDHLLAHVAGRPVSLVRTPDGIDEQRFFQRHPMAGMSALIRAVQVRDEKAPYLEVDSVRGAGGAGAGGRDRDPPLGRAHRGHRASRPAGLRPRPGGRRAVPRGRPCGPGGPQAPGATRPGAVREDHGRQGPACRRAAEAACGLGRGQGFRPRALRSHGKAGAAALHHRHGQAGPGGADLPRLPQERPDCDGGGGMVAAGPTRCAGFHAPRVAGGDG